jgi:hypothetical protein
MGLYWEVWAMQIAGIQRSRLADADGIPASPRRTLFKYEPFVDAMKAWR